MKLGATPTILFPSTPKGESGTSQESISAALLVSALTAAPLHSLARNELSLPEEFMMLFYAEMDVIGFLESTRLPLGLFEADGTESASGAGALHRWDLRSAQR